MHPLYIAEAHAAPINLRGLWFNLTQAIITLKRKVFPKFIDSERGDQYVLDEEPRDPETT